MRRRKLGREEEEGRGGCRRGNVRVLLHNFATGLGYLVGTSGHKPPSSCLLSKDLKAPCHNKATGTPQPFLEEIRRVNSPTYTINNDVYFKLVCLVLPGMHDSLEKCNLTFVKIVYHY